MLELDDYRLYFQIYKLQVKANVTNILVIIPTN